MYNEDLLQLAQINDLPVDSVEEIVSLFMSNLYHIKKKTKGACNDINLLRYNIAIEKYSNIAKLHSSKSAILKHILRALWQLNEWKKESQTTIVSENVIKFGWMIQEGKLWRTDSSWNITKVFLFLSWENSCSTLICPCIQSNLKCCDICNCNDSCDNIDKINEYFYCNKRCYHCNQVTKL